MKNWRELEINTKQVKLKIKACGPKLVSISSLTYFGKAYRKL